jgi:hypothetical protein
MSNDHKHEDKPEIDYHEGHDAPPSGAVGRIAGMVAPKERVGDGDIGARWLEEYTGDRPELSDEDNKRVSKRIDRYLMPMCVSHRQT